MSDRCTEFTCPYHGERNRSAAYDFLMETTDPATYELESSEDEGPLCACGYESDSFACKIRHVQVNTGWAKSAND